MKRIALFMSALALMVFTSCEENNNSTDLDNVVEDGFFVAGPATGSDVLEAKYMMTAGINEVDKSARDGMYEKYIVLEAGKDFYLTLNEAGESLRYSAALEDINLADRTGEGAYADNPAIVIRKGELKAGPDAPAMRVEKTGLYHIVLDLNKAEDLQFAQIIVVPCEWGVRGINGDWGYKKMDLNVDGNKYVYSISFDNMAASTFKFSCCNGWKITLDVDGKVKAETSLGQDLKTGGDNIVINPGEHVTITFTFDLAAGDHSKSFSWKADGVNENYSPADFAVGVSGDLHASVGNWSSPEGATLAQYSAADSDPSKGIYVYWMNACPFKANAQFKFRKDGDWIPGNASYVTVSGVTVSGDDNLTFGSEAGVYKVKFTLTCDGITIKSYKAEFTKTGDLPKEEVVETQTLKFTVKINKALAWENLNLYTWYGASSTTASGVWPGTALTFEKEEGNYKVYSCNIAVAVGTTEVNYIVNYTGGQTADLKTTLTDNTVVTIEK